MEQYGREVLGQRPRSSEWITQERYCVFVSGRHWRDGALLRCIDSWATWTFEAAPAALKTPVALEVPEVAAAAPPPPVVDDPPRMAAMANDESPPPCVQFGLGHAARPSGVDRSGVVGWPLIRLMASKTVWTRFSGSGE